MWAVRCEMGRACRVETNQGKGEGMSIFKVGDSVVLIKGQDILDYQEMATIGEVGVVLINTGLCVIEDYEASYNYVVAFPSYENLCCYHWQLAPVNKNKNELMLSLMGEVVA